MYENGGEYEYLTQEEKKKMNYLINQYQIDQYQEFRKNTMIYGKVLKNIYKTLDIYQSSFKDVDMKKRNVIECEMRIINKDLRNLNFKLREMIYQMKVEPNTMEDNIMEEIYRVRREREFEKNMIRPYLPCRVFQR